MLAIAKLRHTSDTVQRAQPFFLGLICVGALVTSTAILALSWDESYGATDPQLDAACMASQWTFFVGHVMTYMALFSKLWRIDSVLHFRRNNVVSVRQVLWPLVLLMGLTLVILTLWTALDPWRVTRLPPETYGACASDHFWAFFGPLMGIVVVAEALTTFFAFRTSDVPEDFGDSRTALFAIYTHVQSWGTSSNLRRNTPGSRLRHASSSQEDTPFGKEHKPVSTASSSNPDINLPPANAEPKPEEAQDYYGE